MKRNQWRLGEIVKQGRGVGNSAAVDADPVEGVVGEEAEGVQII